MYALDFTLFVSINNPRLTISKLWYGKVLAISTVNVKQPSTTSIIFIGFRMIFFINKKVYNNRLDTVN